MKHFSEAGPARSFWNNNVSEDLLLRPHMSRGELLTNRRCVDVDCVEVVEWRLLLLLFLNHCPHETVCLAGVMVPNMVSESSGLFQN